MQKHHWKRLFFLLFGLNITFVIIVLVLINLPGADQSIPEPEPKTENSVTFEINTNRNDANKLINSYIQKNLTGALDYNVYLEKNEVVLSGELPIFGHVVNTMLSFKPTALENGNLVLEQEQFSMGKLKLSVPLLLKVLQESYQLPDWITIQPKEEKIYVSLDNIKLNNESRLKAKEFDLQNDKIVFLLEIPVE
nr:YpmS family protein [uncultured Bacillus sp.]